MEDKKPLHEKERFMVGIFHCCQCNTQVGTMMNISKKPKIKACVKCFKEFMKTGEIKYGDKGRIILEKVRGKMNMRFVENEVQDENIQNPVDI